MDANLRWTTVCIDGRDAESLADFYCRLLGWQITARDGHGWVQAWIPMAASGSTSRRRRGIARRHGPRNQHEQAKMLHFEILVDDLEAAVADAVAAGATVAPHQPPDRDESRLRVMLDPAGHPFCLFVAGE